MKLISKLLLTTITIALCNLSLDTTAQTLKFAQTPEKVGFSSTKFELLSQDIQQLVDKNNISGAVGLIIRHGKIAYHQEFGFQDLEQNILMQENSIFRIASNTKIVTSFAVHLLREDGLIDLQDPVSKYIPSFANMEILVPGDSEDLNDFTIVIAQHQITIENLLNHTSGLDYNLNNNMELITL